jgi:ABC-type transport system involved in multi-copper enzyme maturation permease subunit
MMAIVAAEWTKIRTLRSTYLNLFLTVLLSVGLGILFGLSFRNRADTLPGFDPLFATFYSLTIGQLSLVVLAVLLVTSEYSSGTIRASLAATPRRGRWYAGKLLAVAGTILPASVVTVLATSATVQSVLGPSGTSLGADGVGTAVVGAILYLTLISLFAAGVATMLRNAAAALGIMLPLLFLGSQGLGNVPALKTFWQYLPDQAGWVIMRLNGPAGDPRWARSYGPWEGIGILALWAVAALVGGYLVLRRKDA